MSETWMDMEGAAAFLKSLVRKRDAEVNNLIGAAGSSTDPAMRAAYGRLMMLDTVIKDMEDERGNSEE